MPMRTRMLVHGRFLLATTACAAAALILSILCRNFAMKSAVPLTFLLVLVPVALFAGRMASVAAVLVCSLIFAVFLFEPYGSFAIRNAVDRMELLCYVLAAFGVVIFSPRSATSSSRPSSSLLHTGSRANTASQLENWIAVVGYAVVLSTVVTLLLYAWDAMRH